MIREPFASQGLAWLASHTVSLRMAARDLLWVGQGRRRKIKMVGLVAVVWFLCFGPSVIALNNGKNPFMKT